MFAEGRAVPRRVIQLRTRLDASCVRHGNGLKQKLNALL
jgi:hypothetical protein